MLYKQNSSISPVISLVYLLILKKAKLKSTHNEKPKATAAKENSYIVHSPKLN